MKFFIDTGSVAEIREAEALGILDGVTTNPSLLAREAGSPREVLSEICKIVSGPVSGEVIATDYEGMVREGRELVKIADNLVVKIPMTKDGVKACRSLSREGIKVNMTLVFSASQAILAAKAGATFVSPFVGRVDDISGDGMDLISQLVQIFNNYQFETEILVASIRHPLHVVQSAMLGADVVTMPFNVIDKLFRHPLTDIGLEKFLNDYKKSNQK